MAVENVCAAGALIVLAMVSSRVGAQESNPRAVQPERPTVATHAGTVFPGILEIETGIERDRPSRGITSFISPSVLKIGLTGRAQLNVFAPVVRPYQSSSRLGDLAFGVKWR